ncbi:hypothetical protein Taro_009834 [Colocasia esculenta]|uniref:GTP cyclohydrolase 1 n=1 Tax=Colocasia esculenta TaxID=4460 RepID=A0A843U217_COLES|nr:hypothetical protein [Colocasia esculenta]
MGALGDGFFGAELACNGMGHVFIVDMEGEEEEVGVGGCGSVSESTAGIEDAVKVLLQGLGEDPDRDGLKRTPLRVAKAFRDGTRGYRQYVHDIVQGALFPEAGSNIGTGQAGGTGGLVVVRDITLFSYCESCLLPFKVQCHVGYVPSGQRVVGLSKLARVADVFAKRLQDPQRLANDICSALQCSIKPAGVAVFLQCWHLQIPEVLKDCSAQREPSKSDMQGWLQAPAYSCSGAFEDEKSSFGFDFFSLLKFRGVTVVKNQTKVSSAQHCWCPLKSQEMPLFNGHNTSPTNGTVLSKAGATQAAMLAAVTSILTSLGEDPQRRELVGTPYRFVQWLMNFKRSSFELKMNGFNHGIASFYKKTDGVHDQSAIHSELNLPFCSQCEHHLLPFHGVVHIGFFGSQELKAVDRSILQSVVHFYGSKLQVQERMTRQIADTVFSIVHRGVIVVVEANHICMISRGIEKVGSSTATIAVLGQFLSNIDAKETFLQAISNSTASGG